MLPSSSVGCQPVLVAGSHPSVFLLTCFHTSSTACQWWYTVTLVGQPTGPRDGDFGAQRQSCQPPVDILSGCVGRQWILVPWLWKCSELLLLDQKFSNLKKHPYWISIVIHEYLPTMSGWMHLCGATLCLKEPRLVIWLAFKVGCLVRGASQVMPVVKDPSCRCWRPKRCRFDPKLGRSPGGGHGNPLQYSCLEIPMDRGAWWVHRVMELDTTEATWHTCMHLVRKVPSSQDHIALTIYMGTLYILYCHLK